MLSRFLGTVAVTAALFVVVPIVFLIVWFGTRFLKGQR